MFVTVTYIGVPSQDAPLGDQYTADYPDAGGYKFDPEDGTFTVITHNRTRARITTIYPTSKVIRVTRGAS